MKQAKGTVRAKERGKVRVKERGKERAKTIKMARMIKIMEITEVEITITENLVMDSDCRQALC